MPVGAVRAEPVVPGNRLELAQWLEIGQWFARRDRQRRPGHPAEALCLPQRRPSLSFEPGEGARLDETLHDALVEPRAAGESSIDTKGRFVRATLMRRQSRTSERLFT